MNEVPAPHTPSNPLAPQTPVASNPPPQPPKPPVANLSSEQPKPPPSSTSPYLIALGTLALGIILGFILCFLFPGNKPALTTNTQTQSDEIVLPKDADKVEECVDHKGALYVRSQDIPVGPMYMVQNNKVIGLEYLLNQDQYTQGRDYPNLQTLNMHINHMRVTFSPVQMQGNSSSQYHLDLYLVDKKTEDAITCNQTVPLTPQASPSGILESTPSAKPTIRLQVPVSITSAATNPAILKP